MHPTSTSIVSDNIEFIGEAWSNMHNWMDDKGKRKKAMQMLKQFQRQVDNEYWITDDEELFLATITHTIESSCYLD